MASPVYAIDFGTSNSLLGAAGPGGPGGFAPLDPDAPDPAILRSLLYFPNARELYFGERALREFGARDHSGRFIRSIKKQLPSRSFIGTYVENRPFNLEDLIALLLSEMRKRANAHFGDDVTRVVLGRPARFAPDEGDDRYAQERLERAARHAGFKEIEFLPEPVAAALGYDPEGAQARDEELVLAADFGGGTSDFTVYRLRDGRFHASDVLAMGGLSVAGDALDSALMRHRISPYFGTGVRYQVPFGSNVLTMPTHLMERICHPGEISLLRKQDTMEFFRNVRQWSLGEDDRERIDRLFTLLNDQLGLPLFEKIEGVKKALSAGDDALFDFDYPEIRIREKIRRKEFEAYAENPLEAIVRTLDETLADGGIAPERIDRVLCTGGTAKVPWLRDALTRRFGAEKLHDLDPFRGVARGLMVRAGELA
ncbi:MAG: Hsp70 family protein [Oligoflexia bacterium]|nr:Hsp70 family protein [Oligoflexia bacterium]